MLGNGGSGGAGGIGGRTGVIQGYTGVGKGAAAKKAKQSGAVDEAKADRIDRDDPSNGMLVEIVDDRGKKKENDVLCPPGHSPGVRYVEGDAFRTDKAGRTMPPTFSEVDQGNLGDSWLLASLAAIAHAAPQHLLKRCDKTKNSDGEFGVRLGKIEIPVSPEFSAEGYADPIPNGQTDTLWVALFEKAFAKREGNSYAALEIGNPSRALELLTGRPSIRMSISMVTELDRISTRISDARKDGCAMVLITRESGVSSPMHPEHVYAVLDMYEKSGEKIVKVYNPWGTKGGSRAVDNVIHEVKLDDLRTNCAALVVSGG
jgi:calpain family cysteine protease